MKIGHHTFVNNLVLAPMAGITDLPFRQLCQTLGVGLTVSEMVASQSLLWGSLKTQRRMAKAEHLVHAVQVVGSDPKQMAEAAQKNVDEGAEIIDINMGCPASRICHAKAGASLLRYPDLIGKILDSVVRAVAVPVTLKIRTGWDKQHRNALEIARLAESSGIQSLAVHGRTRACSYSTPAEYETIQAIKAEIKIPVIANGDIDTPEKARYVLEKTGADSLMIGRAAWARPWLFREINHYLVTGESLAAPTLDERYQWAKEHLQNTHQFYGESPGLCMVRKHVSWYSYGLPYATQFRRYFNALTSPQDQLNALDALFLMESPPWIGEDMA